MAYINGNRTLFAPAGTSVNPNLLINGDFQVNQRGASIYTRSGNSYTVDRWFLWSATGTFNVETKTLTSGASQNCILSQYLIDTNIYLGKTITLSVKIDGTLQTCTGTVANSYEGVTADVGITSENFGNGYIRLRYDKNKQLLRVDISPNAATSIIIGEAKLEIGSIATPYSPKTYGEELEECRFYYKRIQGNGTSENYAIASGVANSTTSAIIGIPIGAMRVDPVMTYSGGFAIFESGSSYNNITNITKSSASTNELLLLSCTTTGLVAGQCCFLTSRNDADAYIEIDAEYHR